MIQPPRPGRRYTKAQIDAMRAKYPNYQMPGHYMRIENGWYSFVPYTEASDWSEHAPRGYVATWDENPFPVEPIRKRTPQQRLDSLVQLWLEDCKKAGTVPGLSDEKVQELVANSWKRGQPFTAEHVRAVAASYLADAEAKYEASERKKIVRTSPTD